jgi:sulfate permease, SulP family
MPHTLRPEQFGTGLPLRQLPGAALRATLAEGYSGQALRRDVLAGLVVGVVALPLSMALAIAVGVAPQHGLYTAIVAGFAVAALGGSRTQVTGPTAAFIVILAPIAARFGLAGLLLSGALGGLLLIGMGLLRMGKLIQFIPHPVTTGFTTGIATVIFVLQLKDLLGLRVGQLPDHFVGRVVAMGSAWRTVSFAELAVAALTLGGLLALPRLTRRLPAPLLVLPVSALAAALLEWGWPGFEVLTVAERFVSTVGGAQVHGVPQLPPLPLWPWQAPGPGGLPLVLSWETVRALLPGAFAVAMLGAIESLLSAVVADGMAGTKHDPDAELLALGAGNVLAPFFGGIPATGALARTATNVRAGARSPVSAMVHALTVLAAVLLLAPLIGYLPMAALAGLLVLVAWNMSELGHFSHIVRVAPRGDVVVLLTCFSLTVLFDMVIAVGVGVVLGAFLFMRRIVDVTQARLVEPESQGVRVKVPPGVLVYDIAGPLFFGAAEKAMSTLQAVNEQVKVVVLRLEQVPAMDVTGLVALESALGRLWQRRCLAVLCGVQPQPAQVLRNAGLAERLGRLAYAQDLGQALERARAHLEAPPHDPAPGLRPPAPTQ